MLAVGTALSTTEKKRPESLGRLYLFDLSFVERPTDSLTPSGTSVAILDPPAPTLLTVTFSHLFGAPVLAISTVTTSLKDGTGEKVYLLNSCGSKLFASVSIAAGLQ